VANFFFLDVKEVSDVFDHLFAGESQFFTGWAIRRGRSDDIRGVASAVGGRRQARGDKDGRRQVGHVWNGWAVMGCVEGEK